MDSYYIPHYILIRSFQVSVQNCLTSSHKTLQQQHLMYSRIFLLKTAFHADVTFVLLFHNESQNLLKTQQLANNPSQQMQFTSAKQECRLTRHVPLRFSATVEQFPLFPSYISSKGTHRLQDILLGFSWEFTLITSSFRLFNHSYGIVTVRKENFDLVCYLSEPCTWWWTILQ